MSFRTRNPGTRIVVLGDDVTKGERPMLEGVLAEIRPSPKYPSNPLYTFQLDDGSTVDVAGSTILNNHVHADDVGKRVRLTFRGWATSRNGTQYRDIGVEVDEPLAPLAPAHAVAGVAGLGPDEEHAPPLPEPPEEDDEPLPY